MYRDYQGILRVQSQKLPRWENDAWVSHDSILLEGFSVRTQLRGPEAVRCRKHGLCMIHVGHAFWDPDFEGSTASMQN